MKEKRPKKRGIESWAAKKREKKIDSIEEIFGYPSDEVNLIDFPVSFKWNANRQQF